MNLFTIYGARTCRMYFIENFRVLLGFSILDISCLDWVVVRFHDDSLECFDCNFEVDSFLEFM